MKGNGTTERMNLLSTHITDGSDDKTRGKGVHFKTCFFIKYRTLKYTENNILISEE
jgi:hypothetical protein